MAHYAKIVDTKVTKVIVADAAYFDDFVDDSPGTWIKVSINTRGGIHYAPYSHTPDDGTPLRKNYPGIGWTYDLTRDAFYEPQCQMTIKYMIGMKQIRHGMRYK